MKSIIVNIFKNLHSRNLLIIILGISFFLRVYKLNIVPPHLTPDEASLGYNAYSILKTGKDEYGEVLPIIFKSFGDYKPGFYVYTAVPFVAILGLSEFAVRLPSAIAGVFAVYLIYKIVGCLLMILNSEKKGKTRSQSKSHTVVPLLSAALLAFNPWHLHFSRGAWEANLSLTLTLAGIYFFLKSVSNSQSSIQDKILSGEYLIVSSILFSLTYVTYQGAKLSTTIVIFVLSIFFFNAIKKLYTEKKRFFVASVGVGILICLPVLGSFVSGQTGRLEVYSVFSYPRPQDYLQAFLDQGNETIGSISYYLFHPEWFNFTRGIFGRYFNHFSSDFLFFVGDWQNLRHSPPYHGMMLIIDSVLLVLGTVSLIKRGDKVSAIVFTWLLLSPLPAALSRDQVQAVRSINMLIPLVIISAFGFYQIIKMGDYYTRKIIKYSFYASFSIMFISSLIYYFDSYYVHMPINDAEYWQYGYKQAYFSLDKNVSSDEKVIFQQSYSQPYIYYLFYNRIDPSEYQSQANLTDSGLDVGLVPRVNNITFMEYSWPPPAQSGNVIVGNTIVIPQDENDGYQLIEQIDYPEGKPAFRIIRKL